MEYHIIQDHLSSLGSPTNHLPEISSELLGSASNFLFQYISADHVEQLHPIVGQGGNGGSSVAGFFFILFLIWLGWQVFSFTGQ